MEILHVARAPAFVAAQEFRHGRRVGFQAAILRRQAAHAPAGGLQAHTLDHIVGQDAAAIGQRLQPRMAAEGLAAEDGVVAPIGAGIALPPGLARGPAPHARAHAELEQPREGRRCRPPHDQLLHDGKARIRFHDRDQTQHGVRRHHAVGVQRDEERGFPRVMVQEVHHIAGLEAVIGGAAAIADGRAAGAAGGEGADGGLLRRRDGGVLGVRQQPQHEAIRRAPRRQPIQQRAERRQHGPHLLVADADGECSEMPWRAGARMAQRGQHRARRIARGQQDGQPHQGIARRQRRPGRHQQQAGQDQRLCRVHPARRQSAPGEPEQDQRDGRHQPAEQAAPQGNVLVGHGGCMNADRGAHAASRGWRRHRPAMV